MTSRNDNAVTAAWPDLSRRPARRPRPAARRRGDRAQRPRAARLPGAAAPDARPPGRPTRRGWPSGSRPRCMVFDLLRLDGDDLTGRPLAERRALLEGLGLEQSTVAGPRVVRRRGRCCGTPPASRGSRASSASGVSSPLPLRHPQQGLAQAGPPPPRHLRRRRLATAGRHQRPAGGRAGGRADRRRADVPRPGRQRHHRRDRPACCRTCWRRSATGRSPFADEVPRVDALGTTWVEPIVVVDVDTHGLGYDRLRQPSFQGVRSDLTPEDLT